MGGGRGLGGRVIHGVLMTMAVAVVPQAGWAAERQIDLSLGGAYRFDKLRWSIAGNIYGTNPNILSELTWSELETLQAQAQVEVYQGLGYLSTRLAYGEILAGHNQDSDYLGDYRTNEYSRSNNLAVGQVGDASVGLGWRLKMLDHATQKYWHVAPMLGMSVHYQWLGMREGVQTVTTGTPPLGPFSGLDSAYDARWQSLWAGGTLWADIGHDTDLKISFEYHWADYDAEANWNLRTDLQHPLSFKHEASGEGVILAFEGVYHYTPRWDVKAGVHLQEWSAGPGWSATYTTSAPYIVYTRLNKVEWSAQALSLQAVYKF